MTPEQPVAESVVCVVTVGGKDEGFPKCDAPAVTRATDPPYWPLCEEHTKLALIAGWKPERL